MPASMSLSTHRTIYLYSYIPCYCFVLDCYLVCSILVVYISPFARPRLGIKIQLFIPPSLHSRVHHLKPQVSCPLRTRSRAIGAIWAQHGLHCDVSPCTPSCVYIHTHTHTLSLSLSLSLPLSGSRDNNPHTLPHVQPCVRSHFGDITRLFYFTLFRTHVDSHSAIQYGELADK
jgi:hypothetical protein